MRVESRKGEQGLRKDESRKGEQGLRKDESKKWQEGLRNAGKNDGKGLSGVGRVDKGKEELEAQQNGKGEQEGQ